MLDEGTLEELVREGAAAWPGVRVAREDFADIVREAMATTGNAPAQLHTRDLYLVAACLAGDDAAIAVFTKDVIGAVTPAVERASRQRGNTEDVIQTTLAKLLVGPPTPQLRSYLGKGALVGWVRVIAVREALQAHRKTRRELLADEDLIQGASTGASIEVKLLKQRHGASFDAAVIEATKRLTSEQRTILRFHVRDRLSIDRIAPMLGIHRATAARRLTQAREDVLAHTKAILRERHGLSESEVASLCTALGGSLDLSMGRALETNVG